MGQSKKRREPKLVWPGECPITTKSTDALRRTVSGSFEGGKTTVKRDYDDKPKGTVSAAAPWEIT